MIEVTDLAARLTAFIGAAEPEAREITVSELSQVAGGNARAAWGFDACWTVDAEEGEGALDVPCILLMQAGAGQLESDLTHEFAVLRALEGSAVPVPAALWIDPDGAALGAPSIILQRVHGASDIAAIRAPEPAERNRAIALAFADAAAALHAFDWRGRLRDGPPAPDAVAGAQIALWEGLFHRHRMEPHPAFAFAFDWMKRHQPVAGRVALVHGDFRFGNFLYDGTRITALLDWEMAHLGDPAEDIAWAYRSLWTPGPHLTIDDFLARYAQAGGPSIAAENLLFYRLLGEIKHAVISMTAARSFADGRTRNLRMADRMSLVPPCLAQFLEWLPR